MDNRKKNFVYMTEFFFFFIWKMLYCGEMTGGKSMNKKGCNLKKIFCGGYDSGLCSWRLSVCEQV